MIFHLIHTCQTGPKIKSGSLTRAAIVRICKRLSEKWGLRVFPEPITDGFIKVDVPIGYKCCRMHTNPIVWPSIKGDELETWAQDESIVFPDLSDCRMFLKGFDGAFWCLHEVVDIARELERGGVVIKNGSVPRKIFRSAGGDSAMTLWCERTRGLPPDEIITDEQVLGLLSFSGQNITNITITQGRLMLRAAINNLLEKPPIVDPVTVVVDDEKFQVRRRLLTDTSDVFKAMLESPMQEGLSQTIDLTGTGIPAKSIRKILEQLEHYKPYIPKWCKQDAVQFAQMYMCPLLVN